MSWPGLMNDTKTYFILTQNYIQIPDLKQKSRRDFLCHINLSDVKILSCKLIIFSLLSGQALSGTVYADGRFWALLTDIHHPALSQALFLKLTPEAESA